MKRRLKFVPTSTQIVMFSFLAAILLGSVLLVLPISSADGESVPYIDALFTATTATCVTGLVTLPTVSTWSIFGQVIILILIQIGGLGIITVMSGLMLALNRKMGLRDSQLIGDAFNLNSLSGLGQFVKRVIIGTLIVELIGALLYMTVFIPYFGARGIWISVFNSVSAFCNAGIDIVGHNSLCDYACNPLINGVTGALVILGGIGYIVWWDVLRVLKNIKKQGVACLRGLTLHSKIAICATLILIFGGALLILVFEYGNPLTLRTLSTFDKIQTALFQSITTRTAGFASLPQENLTDASAIISMVLMFIGGSPVGTAGGIKTVSAVVIMATATATIRNRGAVTMFNRELSHKVIGKAVAVTAMSFAIMLASTICLMQVTDAPAMDVLYETVSATATVGLTRNFTSTLDVFGKLIIIFTMYLGRIGPISLAVVFNSKKQTTDNIKNPIEEISVG